MRYSVVLPRVEATDADEAREALDRAQELWTKGEQRAALEHVRQAAEAANATGQKARALALSRSVTMLARAIGASSMPPPMVSEAPIVSAPRRKSRTDATAMADTEPPLAPPPRSHREGKNAPPKPPSAATSAGPKANVSAASLPATPAAIAAHAPHTTAPSMTAVGRVSAPGIAAVSGRVSTPDLAAAPVSIREAAPLVEEARIVPAPSSEPTLAEVPVEDPDENTALIVTIAPSDWNLASQQALVGHSAQRVAVAPGRGPGGTLMVRPLAPGEVAPRGSTVAVIVALEPGALPLPQAG
ncbi:MAG TPA: hypothetical protein VHC69_19695 [Polyangiaceae bacterium]|nr:hypothetical protein [Polyangiaceae bacterium]